MWNGLGQSNILLLLGVMMTVNQPRTRFKLVTCTRKGLLDAVGPHRLGNTHPCALTAYTVAGTLGIHWGHGGAVEADNTPCVWDTENCVACVSCIVQYVELNVGTMWLPISCLVVPSRLGL